MRIPALGRGWTEDLQGLFKPWLRKKHGNFGVLSKSFNETVLEGLTGVCSSVVETQRVLVGKDENKYKNVLKFL